MLLVAAAITSPAHAQAPLDDALAPYLGRHQLPALAAAVVARGTLVAAGAAGTRRAGLAIRVTPDDRFHLGECTQPMTALLAAMLVEEKRLLWSSTVAEVFHELAKDMNPALGRVSLEQLLAHASGIPVDNADFHNLQRRAGLEEESLAAQRYWLVREWASLPLAALPGERVAPATMNYVIAGAMLERAAARTWEELVTERIFLPLGARTAGLGVQSSPGRVDAPLGHRIAADGRIEPLLAGPDAGRALLLGPAGGAHMSAPDFARWVAFSAGQGARGWLERKPPWVEPQGAARPLAHCRGSNGNNLAHAWLDREARSAIVLLTNVAGPRAEAALDALARELARRFLKN